jgi:hypothetical protein
LPSTSNKNTAKVRLLDAISQCKLEVPAWILNMEAELKKEWEKETAKSKKGVKGATKGNTKIEKDVRRSQPCKNGVNVTGKTLLLWKYFSLLNICSKPIILFRAFYGKASSSYAVYRYYKSAAEDTCWKEKARRRWIFEVNSKQTSCI